jgi:TetR/AcrR family transcriptional regulator, regulator of cefoperazone and chloramphenicol sensitivity
MGAEHQPDTRQRLLDAAGAVFAERGYRQATVREICRRANANIAAVNYHFRDKEGLYAAVLRAAHLVACAPDAPATDLDAGDSPERRLHDFIRSFLLRLFDPGRPAWYGLLMARETIEPTAALDRIIEEFVRPRYERLQVIVRELAGGGAPEEKIQRCAQSIVGQCMYYHYGRRVLARLRSPDEEATFDAERLADHITEFSLGAVRHLAISTRSVPS